MLFNQPGWNSQYSTCYRQNVVLVYGGQTCQASDPGMVRYIQKLARVCPFLYLKKIQKLILGLSRYRVITHTFTLDFGKFRIKKKGWEVPRHVNLVSTSNQKWTNSQFNIIGTGCPPLRSSSPNFCFIFSWCRNFSILLLLSTILTKWQINTRLVSVIKTFNVPRWLCN